MGGLIERLFGGHKPSSSSVAKERLQLVLVHDRSNLTPEQVAAMKDEILEVIARYVEFDRDAVSIDLKSSERENYLLAEIPIRSSSVRRRPSSSPAS
ncbi:MAG: cell division topological specificity factor MinE [Anaerolineae bacterium]|nr:cell division topological specificity factor MinE [Anaerolineae bacterium]